MTSKGKNSGNLTDIPGTPAIDTPKVTRKESRAKNKEMLIETQATESALIAQQQAVDGELINPVGRPSILTPSMRVEIMALLSMGKSVRTICRDARMPGLTTFYNWLQTDKEFQDQYTRAKSDAADAMLEDIFDISDDAQNDYMEVTYGDQSVLRTNIENIQRSKLRVETRKWAMSKLQPRKYGDKLDVTSDGKQLPVPLLQGLVEASQNTNDDIKEDEDA